jgi:hypothetical protein
VPTRILGNWVWLEKASEAQPHWHYLDKSGNPHRMFFSLERVIEAGTSVSATSLIIGRWKLTFSRLPA